MLRTKRQVIRTKRRIFELETYKKKVTAVSAIYTKFAAKPATNLLASLESELEALKSAQKEYRANSNWNDGVMPQLETTERVGKDLIQSRLYLGWSMSYLAKRCELNERQIERYEKREYEQAKLSRIIQIANVLRTGYEEHKQMMEEINSGTQL